MQRLVDYSSEEDEEQSTTGESQVRRRLPPLSALFVDQVDVANTPLNGRIRTTPHVEGNWATHVFISVLPQADMLATLKSVIASVQNEYGADRVHSLLEAYNDALHISLTRTIYLSTEQREPFLRTLQDALMGASPFSISMSNAPRTLGQHQSILSNDNKTRHFLCIPIEGSYVALNDLVERCNGVCRQYGQPAFYEDPKFHASIAWWLDSGDKALPTEESIRRAFSRLGEQDKIHHQEWKVSSISCKIGKKVWDMSLG